MKKYLLPIMALALSFSFVACGDDEDEKKPTPETPTEKVNYLYSFEKKSYGVVDETTITFSILNAKDASTINAEEDIHITLAVDPSSTAKEGEDFELPSKEITILKGKHDVEFTIKAKTTNPKAEANTIVLKPVFSGDNFVAGQYPTVKVVLVGSFAKNLVGTWVMNELVTDREYMVSMWGIEDDYVNFPEFNAEDQMTFDATLVPGFKSGLKNFFIGEATYENAGSYLLQGMTPIQLQVLKLTGVNRNFSASSQSENKVAYIGVRNIDDGSGNDLLDVYLLDFVPTDFAQTAVMYQCYEPFDESGFYAAMSGSYVNFTMKKAQ